jgi:hypothetical protein
MDEIQQSKSRKKTYRWELSRCSGRPDWREVDVSRPTTTTTSATSSSTTSTTSTQTEPFVRVRQGLNCGNALGSTAATKVLLLVLHNFLEDVEEDVLGTTLTKGQRGHDTEDFSRLAYVVLEVLVSIGALVGELR